MFDLEFYMSLPWTVASSKRTGAEEYLVVEIEELPGFVVTGESPEEIDEEFWAALRDFLESYLEEGLCPPTPEGVEVWPESPPPSAEERDMSLSWGGTSARKPKRKVKQPHSGSLPTTDIHRYGPGSQRPRTGPAVPA